MKFRNSLDFINEFFLNFSHQIRRIYLSSNIYDKKISKVNQKSLSYRPSLNILSCLVKYEKKRSNVKIVKESDVKNWPGVKSGYLSEIHALEMFRNYFQ